MLHFSVFVIGVSLSTSTAFFSPLTTSSHSFRLQSTKSDEVAAASAPVPEPVSSPAVPPPPPPPPPPPIVQKSQAEINDEKFPEAARADLSKINPGRFSGSQSLLIPFLPRPPHLDGSHAGDVGFDPLGLGESSDLYYMQESEVRHSRLAMLAVVGWPLAELVGPDWLLASGHRAPSLLNGNLLR